MRDAIDRHAAILRDTRVTQLLGIHYTCFHKWIECIRSLLNRINRMDMCLLCRRVNQPHNPYFILMAQNGCDKPPSHTPKCLTPPPNLIHCSFNHLPAFTLWYTELMKHIFIYIMTVSFICLMGWQRKIRFDSNRPCLQMSSSNRILCWWINDSVLLIK